MDDMAKFNMLENLVLRVSLLTLPNLEAIRALSVKIFCIVRIDSNPVNAYPTCRCGKLTLDELLVSFCQRCFYSK